MLTTQIKDLKRSQLHELHSTMLDACTAAELGGDWREIFRRAKHRKVGRLRRIYELLQSADRQDMASMAWTLTEHLN